MVRLTGTSQPRRRFGLTGMSSIFSLPKPNAAQGNTGSSDNWQFCQLTSSCLSRYSQGCGGADNVRQRHESTVSSLAAGPDQGARQRVMKERAKQFIASLLVISISFVWPVNEFAQTQTPPAPQPPATAAAPATTNAPPGTPAPPPDPGAPWPRQISYQGATIFVFQPQLQSWAGNNLDAYAAVRIKTPNKKDTDYGVIWFTARTEVDKVNRMVTLEDFVLTKQNFPTIANNGAAYKNAFIENLPWSKTIPLDPLETSLAVTNAAASQKSYPLENNPPRVIFSTTPAVLAIIDGNPVLRPSADNLQKVINTRALILFDSSKSMYYLALMDGWVEAPTIQGPWNPAKHAPTKSLDNIRQGA